MLMTDKAKLIRTPVHDIRIAGRNTQGVTIFKIDKAEHVISVSHIAGSMLEGDELEGEEGVEGAEGVVEAVAETVTEVLADESDAPKDEDNA